MKAALLTRPREMVVVDDWPEPAAREGEVIVELTGLGICGSDLELWSGSRPVGGGFPWLIGHEGIGRIVAVGAAVAERRVGERVVIEPNYPCGRCDACLAGRTSTCPNRVIVAINAPGLLQERVAVPAQFAWPAPASVSDADLICTEPLAVARSARVSIVEPQAGRRALAERLGAVAAEPDGTRYPSVFETSGSVGGVRTALELAEPGGTVTLIGIPHDEVTVSFAAIVRDQLEIRGSLIYDHPADFRDTLALLAAGEVAPSRILNGPVPFASVGRALARARDVAGKTWIEYPSGG